MAELEHDIVREFRKRGYQWRVDGELITPTEEEIKQTLDRAREILYAEPIPSQLEIGRLIVRRHSGNNFDVYLQIGQLQ